MKRLFLFTLIVIPLCLFGQLRIDFVVNATEYLPGMPIDIEVRFINDQNTPIKTYWSPCKWERNFFLEIRSVNDIPPLPPGPKAQEGSVEFTIQPHEYVSCTAFPYKLIEPGEYSFRVVFDPMKELSRYPELIDDFYSQRLVSEWITIKVLVPQGEDRRAFKKYVRDANMFNWMDLGEKLLKDYPTSIYAGYVLKKRFRYKWEDYGPIYDIEEYERWVNEVGRSKNAKEKLDDLMKNNNEMAAYLERFLNREREDFLYLDDLKANLAGKLSTLGRYEEANELCGDLILKKSKYAKHCVEFVKYLNEKGYLNTE